MIKKHQVLLARLVFVLTLAAGCKRSAPPAPSFGYFQTDFQDESQFIVETIAADVAEQVYYAKFHRLPATNIFHVTVTETGDSTFAEPKYDVQTDLDAKQRGLKTKVDVNGPIWAPEVYDELVKTLAAAVGLDAGTSGGADNTEILAKLTDGTADTIEKENERLSSDLETDFANPALHEQAAVLLGAFTLREHSGNFFEIRSPVCRITAHLAMARYLRGGNLSPTTGRMAEAMMLTLVNNQAAALEDLKVLKINDAGVTSWVRALQARNTADYRPLDKVDGLSGIECAAWYYALDHSANPDTAWGRLSDVQKKTVDFVRIANAGNFTVSMGRDLVDVSLPLEFAEIGSVYELARGKKLKNEELVPVLNAMPDRCFSPGADGQTGVHVIGWGLWAGFLQRQLCHAVTQNFDLLERRWGVPDDARAFAAKCDGYLAGLRLYPFVRRFDCTDVPSYHASVDDGFKVTVATPQLVPAMCWNYLCYEFSRTEYYMPNSNPHVNEWHNHNPPSGTAYNVEPRLNHPSLTGRPAGEGYLDKLHEMAPYNLNLILYIWRTKYHDKPNYDQAFALFEPLLAYDGFAMAHVAGTIQDDPAKYEQLMSQAVETEPGEYFTLANYYADHSEEDKAADCLEKGTRLDPNRLIAADRAGWLIRYYLKKGRVDDARKEADFAGEVYSYAGLQAKAEFFEATSNYSGAFEWYSKMEERYRDSQPVINFCLRYKLITGDTQYDSEVQKRITTIFPQGITKARLSDFQGAPADGVVIQGENDLIRAAGLHDGDVIVAIFGIRVHNMLQYGYGRESSANPEMDLVVWQGQEYHEIKASPPNHRFGVSFVDYVPR